MQAGMTLSCAIYEAAMDHRPVMAYAGDVFMPIHFLAFDEESRAVLVVVRGSMSLQVNNQ